ncbi:MAG TPA: PIG-L deacetylase family protein [Acidimicrobiales bacterium]|nr:PIG-L deacetylase family protein [Acidimicrobiales bacterium]
MRTDPVAPVPSSALVVIAHPDDESFGLGAILDHLVAGGTDVRVLCFTRGEASTLGATSDLGAVREAELQCAAEVLGVRRVTLLGFADGALTDTPPATLDAIVESQLADAQLLVVFEPDGVTGHPDHRAATAAAERVAEARSLPVLEWGVSPEVAERLNAELGTEFVGLPGVDLIVDRVRQHRAIACHASQARENPVLVRRLALQERVERVRVRPAEGVKP